MVSDFSLARCNVGLRYNGCGSAGFNNDVLNKLNVGYKTTLEAACNKHDVCYGWVSIKFKSRRIFWALSNWKMEIFSKIVNGWNLVIIFGKSFISGISQGFEFCVFSSGSFRFTICFLIEVWSSLSSKLYWFEFFEKIHQKLSCCEGCFQAKF